MCPDPVVACSAHLGATESWEQLGMLTRAYKDEFFYWEIVDMLYKVWSNHAIYVV